MGHRSRPARPEDTQIRESDELFSKIFAKSPIPSSLSKLADSKYTEVNSAWCDFFGLSKDEAVGHTAEELGILDRETLTRLQDMFLHDGAIDGVEVSVHTKSGEEKHILTSVETLSLGEEQYAINMIVDITARKQAQDVLRESEEKYRLLFENMSEGFALQEIITDEQGRPCDFRFLELNPACERLTGLRRAETIGRRVREFAHEPPWIERYGKVALTGEPAHFQDYSTTLERSFEVFAYQPRPGQCAAIFTDITERLNLEEQLRQAQKMEAVGRLAGGVAHDSNNMLNVILGYTELALERTGPSDPLHADLEEILNAARRSTDITRQLLAFARKQTVSPEVLDLNATVEGMLRMLRRLIGEDIDLAWLPKAGLWSVNMDPSQLDQILANFCVNARDAVSDVGKVTIETDNITLDEAYCAEHAGFLPGDFVMLAVSDDGCGMGKEILDNIFEPFFTTKGVGRGTGLGLSTVYGIVKQNGGFVNVYTEPGTGTTFKIYLSRAAGQVEAIASQRPTEIPASRGETVLLVEDEDSVLRLTKKFLVELGYNTLTAGTPQEAIGLAQAYSADIDLLITDVVMPVMNGPDLTAQLHILYPNLKTLFMSGYTANVIAHHGVLETGVHFLQKPFSKKDLSFKVRDALKG